MRNRWLPALGICALVLIYLAGTGYIRRRAKLGSVTLFNRGAAGVSTFVELRERLREKATEVKRTAFLSETELTGLGGIAVLSPAAPLSPRETGLLVGYVEKGGTLFASFHNLDTGKNLGRLLGALQGGAKMEKNPDFRNGESELVQPSVDSTWFRKRERYAVYSPILFDDVECKLRRFDCFIRVVSKGKGRAILLAGLPPFANALLGEADNRQLAFRMVDEVNRLAIDEYHHFFSDRTPWDLLRRPDFSVPIGVMLGLMLLFFLFGRTDFHERSLLEPERPVPDSHHQAAESVALGALRASRARAGALALHARLLARRCPELAPDVARAVGTATPGRAMRRKALLEGGERLLRLHRGFLKRRRKG